MEINYRYTERDLLDAQKAYLEGSSPFRRIAYDVLLWVLRLTVLGLGAFFVLFDRDTRSLGMVFLAISIILIVVAPIARKLRQRRSVGRTLRKNSNLQKEFKVNISERGLETWAENLHTEVGWPHIVRWQESERLFLLYNNPGIYSIFPKSAFAPDEVDQFRKLLVQNVPVK
jgi:hypothetical protein